MYFPMWHFFFYFAIREVLYGHLSNLMNRHMSQCYLLRVCLPAWSASACLLPSPTGTQSPSRPSTGSTATPSTGTARYISVFLRFIPPLFFRPYGFGAWGVGSSGFGYNTMVSSPNSLYGGYHYAGWTLALCFIVNSKLIFEWKIKDWQNSETAIAWLSLSQRIPPFHKKGTEGIPARHAMQGMVIVLLSQTSLSSTLLCLIPNIYIALIPRKEMERDGMVSEALKRVECHLAAWRGILCSAILDRV